MAGIYIQVNVNTSYLQKVVDDLPRVDEMIAERCAGEIWRGATMRVPVRTGYLKSTITQIVTGAVFLVTALAHYAAYVEMGTRKMAAQPYMVPAAEAPNYVGIVEEILGLIGL